MNEWTKDSSIHAQGSNCDGNEPSNAEHTNEHKLDDLQSYADGKHECVKRKSGTQTKKMQNNSAVRESQHSGDAIAGTDLQHVDKSLDGKKNSSEQRAVNHKTLDNHLTKKPRKKDSRRIRFRYVCQICKLAFSSRSLLSNHLMSVHSDDDRSLWPYPCAFCEERFLTYAQLRSHEREIHPEGYWKHLCQTCGKRFSKENGLLWHQLNVHQIVNILPEKRFICDICGKQYSHASKMEMHRRRHKNDRRHACPFCEKRFYMGYSVDQHIVQHLGIQPYACPVCHHSFNCKSNRRLHMKRHHPKFMAQKVAMKCHSAEHSSKSDNTSTNLDSDVAQKVDRLDRVGYRCNQCDAEFTDSVRLSEHQRVTHVVKGLTQFACTICSYRFPSYTHLNKHRKKSGHGAEMVYVCDLCDDKFPTAFRLRVHRFRHFDERPFLCGCCGRRYRSQQQINLHVLSHNDVLKYKCPKCSSVYYSQQLLRLHILRHVVRDPLELTNHRDRLHARNTPAENVASSSKKQMRQYICNECDHVFRTAQTLRVHFQSKHVLQSSYLCTDCGKYFSSLGNLRRHQLIHSGTRKYCCDVCGRQFTQSNTLKEHVRIHTGVRPFVCPVCGHGCTQSSQLTTHMRTHM